MQKCRLFKMCKSNLVNQADVFWRSLRSALNVKPPPTVRGNWHHFTSMLSQIKLQQYNENKLICVPYLPFSAFNYCYRQYHLHHHHYHAKRLEARLVWPFKNTSTTLDTHQPHCSGNWHPEIELLIKNIMFGCTIVLTWQFCLKKNHFSALGGPEVAIFGRYDLGSFKHFVFAYLCVFVIV